MFPQLKHYPMKTQLNYVIESLQKLNLSLLDVVISDDCTTQNISKDTFLKKIDFWFKILKLRNIQQLKYSQSEYHTDVYIFYTENNQYHFSLQINTDALSNQLVSIQSIDTPIECITKTLEESIELKFFIFKDDILNFVPTNNYLESIKMYNDASEYFLQFKTIEQAQLYIIEEWLNEYEDLYDKLNPNKLQFSHHYRFYKLYNFLLDVITLQELESDFVSANSAIHAVDFQNDENISQWLNDFDYLNIEIDSLQIHNSFHYCDTAQEHKIIHISESFQLLLHKSIFKPVYEFISNMEKVQSLNLQVH